MQAGTPFQYAIVITANPNSYSPPRFGGLEIVGGPNQSSSMQWVNGQTSTQLTLSWDLVAPKEGKYTISQAFVNVGSQRLETEAITIEAVKGAANSQNKEEPQVNNKVSGSDIFIRTGASKSKCYVGEQLTIIQKVYSRYQIISFQKFAQPAYDGFYSQAQESASKGQLAMENVDGINYYTYELFRTVAIANKIGKVNLSTVEGDVVIRRQTKNQPRNIFEQFFGAQGYEDVPVNVKSKSMNIEIMPLPENGKPENFKGAVGNFSSKVEVSRRELKANDAFNLKMTISGKGNVKLLEAPTLKLPDSFESYDPKVSEGANSKTFDFLVIPREEGDYKLNDIDFSYFDLDSKKYVTLPSGEIKIKVLPGDASKSGGAQVYSPRTQIKETENDIRYIKKGDFELLKGEDEFFNSFGHLALIAFPLLSLGAGLFIRRNHIKINSNQVLVRERKAAKMAKKTLLLAEKLMKQNEKDLFYTEILLALNGYLGNKLNIPVADLSRETIEKNLSNRQIEEILKAKLFSTIDTSEYAKYAPGAVSGDLQKVYTDTAELIVSLENVLNKKS